MTGLKRVPRSTPTASWFKALRISSQGSGCGRTEIASPSRTATSTELQPPPSPVVAIHAPRRGEAEVDLAPGIAVEAQLGQEALPDQVAPKVRKQSAMTFRKESAPEATNVSTFTKPDRNRPKQINPIKGVRRLMLFAHFGRKASALAVTNAGSYTVSSVTTPQLQKQLPQLRQKSPRNLALPLQPRQGAGAVGVDPRVVSKGRQRAASLRQLHQKGQSQLPKTGITGKLTSRRDWQLDTMLSIESSGSFRMKHVHWSSLNSKAL